MKHLYISIILLFSTNLYAQKEHRFVFFDPCSDRVLELDYQIWNAISDSTIEVEAGQSINVEEDFFLLSTQLQSEKNDWIATFDFHINNLQNSNSDTLYLHRLRAMWNGLLHPQKVEYYLCDSICDGIVEEVDSSGVIRAKGKFTKGTPASIIRFFNQEGKLESKFVYKNGNLKRIK